ncbi:MAG TPA: WYL domain-containing protein [Mycobacteriales bacterium]|nr:WYL domain-containing protein [Mycobacteriales bacterium]
MSATKLERLVNLLLMLLSARRPVTIEQIRSVVPGYDQGDDETFRRMFERDKEELRDLGVPLETQPVDAWGDELGYRVPRESYELPPIPLEPDEAAAVALAARLWQSAGLADASASALLKLRAAGIDPVATAGIEPRVAARDAAFEPLLAAVRAAQAVSFPYRPSYADAPVERTVEPWGLVHRHGNWYVVGHDRDRGERRVFKLSRVAGEVRRVGRPGAFTVPDGVDLRAEVAPFDNDPATGTAVVRLAPGAAWDVRRAATALTDEPDGWTRAEVPLGDVERFAEWLCGFGPDAVVVSPPEARAAVVERLRRVVA